MVNVEYGQRCPAGVAGARRPGPLLLLLLRLLLWSIIEGWVRLQRQLQVQDVIYDMLEDLHLADFLVLRYRGHQALQAAVAVVHVVLQAEQVLLLFHLIVVAPADVEAVLRQIVQREIVAVAVGGGILLGAADRSNSLHFIR